MATKQEIKELLKNLPSQWRDKLADVLCEINNDVNCEQVQECETVTSLSEFEIDGSEVSIQYKDEKGVTVTRSFDVSNIINHQLDDLELGCLTDSTTWASLTYAERFQLLISAHCVCCAP